MIRELLTYLTTNATKEARAFGHLYESISLLQRERRCKDFWLPHRTHCKNTISKVVSSLSAHQRVLVLGSGPLHEIPIQSLASHFHDVDLVDVVHLKVTKEKYKHLKNINFIEADLTELEAIIHQEKKIVNKVSTLFQDRTYDLVISANLLSQLSYHLRDYLEKKAKPKLSESTLDAFAHQVSFDHYQYLLNFKCPVLLITDTESQFIGLNDELIQSQTPYINFPMPKPVEQWWWNLAPRPEFSKDYSVKMKVSVFILNFQTNPF